MRSSTSDFTSSLRSSRGSPSTTPRAQHHGRAGAPYAGMSINVPANMSSPHAHSSSGGSARSSPHGSASATSSRRSSYSSQQPQQQHGYHHTAQQLAPAYLQRAAISNSYHSRGDDETSSNVSESLSIGSASMTGSVGGGGALSSPVGSSGSRYSERGNNFKVVIRVRPPLPRELHGDRPFQNVISVDAPGHVLTVCENLSALTDADGSAAPGAYGSHTFSFDHVYDQQCTQSAVYENTAKAVVESSLEGYNATIFAYGQTGTGKTYTMEGFNSGSGSVEERGIIPRAIEQIFCHIQSNISARMRFLVRASYLQIYNESISDLLKPERNNLTIREDKKRGVFVEGLSEWVVRSPEEIYGLMERGGAMRATGSTKMNEVSSRSHAVFIIIAEQSKTSYVDARGVEIPAEEFTAMANAYQARQSGGKAALKNANGTMALHPKLESMIRQSFKVGKLNLVDLAGSERVRLSGATGQRLEESKKINQSLSALGNVIAALTDARGRQHIPYRDSKLTRILEDSLGGNCKTTMMAMISPALEAITESLSTLKFANRAKSIKNEARVNEDLDQKSLLRKYERELKRLRAELDEKSRNVVDKRRLLELDEQRRRAEEDKMAAIRALEERSREFMKEKEEKKKLEQRISMLTSQMLMSSQRKPTTGADGNHVGGGGAFDAEDPAVRDAIKEHQDRIRKEYECRLADLEKERECIEEEKAQVDRYKQLLLKQRDIMIALTQRLNERDEQITALQDELDAYDRHQKELEEKLDEKTAHLIHLQRVTMEHNATSPGKPNAEVLKALGDWGSSGAVRSSAQALGSGLAGTGGAAAGLPTAELLITHKQFHPHARNQVVYNNNSGSGGGGAHESLLSAEEKMQELKALVDSQAAEHARMARELEEVKSEKVSIEFVLRERVEKLVQTELAARLQQQGLASGGNYNDALSLAQGGKLAQLTKQLKTLETENQQLRQQVRTGGGSTDQQGGEQSRQLQARCETLVKERKAVQTIMEHKIKALVTAISEASDATLQSAGGAEQLGEPAKWLTREVHALQRLVNASIIALRNAEGGSGAPPLPPPANTTKVSMGSEPTPTRGPPPPAGVSTSFDDGASSAGKPARTPNVSVEELIQQRREQIQRERQESMDT